KPIVSTTATGVNGGQEIDTDVFLDPVSGKSYLYWGNGYGDVAELNEDMVSLKEKTTNIITPDETFREGFYVFYCNGTYYFLCSENGPRSENCWVRYGTSISPMGRIDIPE